MNKEIRNSQLSFILRDICAGKKAEMARALGMSNARVGMWFTRSFMDVQLVADTFPQLAGEWLLRGTGEPLLGAENTKQEGIPTSPIETETPEDILAENEHLKEEIKLLRNENHMLFEKLAKYI